MNLVAPSTLPHIRERHIDDSAELAKFIAPDTTVIDLGSGAGFPAVVLAILGWRVFAIESIKKKCDFLNAVKTAIGLENLTIINDRAENIIKNSALSIKNSIFTARAFAPLIRILDWTAGAKIPYVLLKGENVMTEIAEAKKKYKFDYKLTPSSTGPGFVLELKLSSLKN